MQAARRLRSGREFRAALATTRCKDGAPCTGCHALTETMRLGATTVVGLESTLGHDGLRSRAGLTAGLLAAIGHPRSSDNGAEAPSLESQTLTTAHGHAKTAMIGL